MITPTFSILIPTTGRPYLIREAIKSVLQQTCHNWEIIVSDASGSREMQQIVAETQDKRIRYVVTQDHDPSLGWDYAAKQARGDYLMWFDDDNYLLPHSLDVFRKAIERTGAEIITGSHFYYYDRHHPRLKNRLGVVPFTMQEYPVDLKEAIWELFAFTKRGAGRAVPRFHPAATFVSRALVKRAVDRLGFVVYPRMRTCHSIHPILFSFAESCLFIDQPLAIVGRLGVSLSQDWSASLEGHFKKVPFTPLFSPVKGDTKTNNMLENYLRIQGLLPDLLGEFSVNYEQFLKLYISDLCFSDTKAAVAIRNWRGLFSFLRTLSPETRQRLFPLAIQCATTAFFVGVARRLHVQRPLRSLHTFFRNTAKNETGARAKILSGTNEYTIPLERYRIDSISTLASRVREIMLAETGSDILK